MTRFLVETQGKVRKADLAAAIMDAGIVAVVKGMPREVGRITKTTRVSRGSRVRRVRKTTTRKTS